MPPNATQQYDFGWDNALVSRIFGCVFKVKLDDLRQPITRRSACKGISNKPPLIPYFIHDLLLSCTSGTFASGTAGKLSHR